MKQEYLVVTQDREGTMWVAGKRVGEGVSWEQLLDSIPTQEIKTIIVRDEKEGRAWRFEAPHEFSDLTEAIEMLPSQPHQAGDPTALRKEEVTLVDPSVSSQIAWGESSPEFTFKKRQKVEQENTPQQRRQAPKLISTPKAYVPPKTPKEKQEEKPKGPTLKPVAGAEDIDWSTNDAHRRLSLGSSEEEFFEPFIEHKEEIPYPEDIVDEAQVYLPGERRDTRTRHQKQASLTVHRPKKPTFKIAVAVIAFLVLFVLGGRVTAALTATPYLETCVDSRTQLAKTMEACMAGEAYAVSGWVLEEKAGEVQEDKPLPEGSSLAKPSGNVDLKSFEQQKEEQEQQQ